MVDQSFGVFGTDIPCNFLTNFLGESCMETQGPPNMLKRAQNLDKNTYCRNPNVHLMCRQQGALQVVWK